MAYKHPARKFREAKESLARKGKHPDYIMEVIEEMEGAFFDLRQILKDHGVRPCSNDTQQWMQAYQGDPDCGQSVLKQYCPVCSQEVVRDEWGTARCLLYKEDANDQAEDADE